MKLIFRYAAVLTFALLLVGALDGTMDTLQFHYSSSVFKKSENQLFWNPDLSWENKYKRDAEGSLLRPLTPKFFGSSTFLVFATDGWHLLKELKVAIWRTLVLLFAAAAFRGFRWYYWAGVWLAAWLVQSFGFHLLYTYILV